MIYLLGGSGYIGSAFARHLAARGLAAALRADLAHWAAQRAAA